MPIALKTARRVAKLSQAQLAVQSGVEQTIISKIELGKIRKPSHENVVKLCRALGVEPEEIFPVPDEQATAS